MVVLYTLGGIGVVAIALAVGDLFRRKPGRGVRGDRVDARKAETLSSYPRSGGEYLPPAGDERPLR